jgi:hypothetical protein
VKQTASRFGKQLLFVAMVAVLVVLSACGGTPSPSPSPKPSPKPTPSPSPLILPSVSPLPTAKMTTAPVSPEGIPSVRFDDPEEGKVKTTSLVGFAAVPINFNYQNNTYKGPNVKNAGYLYVYLDVDPPTVAGASALSAKGTYVKSDQLGQGKFTGVKNGPHFLVAQLVNFDTTPLDPPVTVKVNFTVAFESPTP